MTSARPVGVGRPAPPPAGCTAVVMAPPGGLSVTDDGRRRLGTPRAPDRRPTRLRAAGNRWPVRGDRRRLPPLPDRQALPRTRPRDLPRTRTPALHRPRIPLL